MRTANNARFLGYLQGTKEAEEIKAGAKVEVIKAEDVDKKVQDQPKKP